MKDLKNRRSKARGAFIRLKNMWRSNSISRKTKLRLYKTLAVPVLLYGCETWKMNKGDDKAIDVRVVAMQYKANRGTCLGHFFVKF